MASKKKIPKSRRCRNPEQIGLYTLCACDEQDKPVRLSDGAANANTDYPDRIRPPEFQSDAPNRESRMGTSQLHRHSKEDLTSFAESAKQSRFRGPVFDFLDVLVGCSSIVFFYFDVVTDILLARDYYKSNNILAFWLTTGFVLGPSLVTGALNFRWYWLDFQSQQIMASKYGKENVKQTSTLLWFSRFLMTAILMGPVMRQLEYIYNGIKSGSFRLTAEERRQHYQAMRMEDVDACCIRMFECFLEAAPQLVLQIYILMANKVQEDTVTEVIRGAAIFSSWVSLSWSMVAYHKALRLSHEDKENMSIMGMFFYFMWRACEIGPRVIAFGLFAALFHNAIFIVVGGHWTFMCIWLFCQKTKFYQNRCEERFFNIVCGYVLVFCFLNVRDGRTRYRMLIYYIIVYAENWAMMGFWFYFTPDKSAWFYLPTFFIMCLGIFLQIFFQLVYYCFLHPLGSGKIPCCPPRRDYTCYRSLCHDLEETEDQYYIEDGPQAAAV